MDFDLIYKQKALRTDQLINMLKDKVEEVESLRRQLNQRSLQLENFVEANREYERVLARTHLETDALKSQLTNLSHDAIAYERREEDSNARLLSCKLELDAYLKTIKLMEDRIESQAKHNKDLGDQLKKIIAKYKTACAQIADDAEKHKRQVTDLEQRRATSKIQTKAAEEWKKRIQRLLKFTRSLVAGLRRRRSTVGENASTATLLQAPASGQRQQDRRLKKWFQGKTIDTIKLDFHLDIRKLVLAGPGNLGVIFLSMKRKSENT